MTARVCDACSPHLDGALEAVASNVAKRAAAEGTAAFATDLVLRWVEHLLEAKNTPPQEHAQSEAELLADSQAYLISAPYYAGTITRATSSGGVGRSGKRPASPAGGAA